MDSKEFELLTEWVKVFEQMPYVTMVKQHPASISLYFDTVALVNQHRTKEDEPKC